jgi:MFS transporter, DHA1 family, multidrug resistance protein
MLGNRDAFRPRSPYSLLMPVTPLLIPLLVLVSMAGPLALNIILPSLPGLPVALSTSKETAQLTLSLFLGAMAVAQLFLGPLADRFGRRPVLVTSMLLFVVASAVAAFAPSIEVLIGARMAQAFGAAAGLTLGRTMLRDLYPREKAASMIGYVTMGMVLAPMVAPALGGFLDEQFGWRSIFFACLALGVVAFSASFAVLPETRPDGQEANRLSDVAARSFELLRNRQFVSLAGTSAAASAMFFAFVGAAPYLVQEKMGLSKDVYGIWFASIALGYMFGNFISGRFSQRIGISRMISWGNWLGLATGLLLTMLALAGFFHPAAIFLPAMLMSIGNGMVMPNAIAGAVSVDPRAAGAASGLTGFMQAALGGVASFLAGWIGGETALPIAIQMLGYSLLALALPLMGRPPQGAASPSRAQAP